MTSNKFISEGWHHQISFGCRPSQLKLLLSDLHTSYNRAVDLGSGTAQHSIAMAQLVPSSTVYSVEPDLVMCEHAARNLREAKTSNVLLKRESVASFSERGDKIFDLLHSCMVAYFAEDKLSDYVLKLNKLAAYNATLIFTDFVLSQDVDEKNRAIHNEFFRLMFPRLRECSVANPSSLLLIFEELGWSKVDNFSIYERYPAAVDSFNYQMPKWEADRRVSIMTDVKHKFFLDAFPSPAMTRTFVFRKNGTR